MDRVGPRLKTGGTAVATENGEHGSVWWETRRNGPIASLIKGHSRQAIEI